MMLACTKSCSHGTLKHQSKYYLSATKQLNIKSKSDVVRGPTKMIGSEAFVETLVSQGVTNVFGIVGSAFMDCLDLFPDAGIKFISCQHEQNSAHMADGYARISNKHGVCIGQNGPGISNFVTGLAAAYWAHSPVVAITPECGSNTKGLGGFQELNQIPLFKEVTKYQSDIHNPDRIPELTNIAFDIALYERGPTQINIPRDLFYHISDTYSIPYPKNVSYPTGNINVINDAVKLISESKNPIILAGGGVRISGKECIDTVKNISELIGSPVCTSYLHNDSFLCHNEYYVGPLGYQGSMAAMKSIHESDLIIAIGSRLNPFGTLPQYGFNYWPKNAKIIQIDIDNRRLGLTKNADIYINGDSLSTSKLLFNELSKNLNNIKCLSTLDERKNNMKQHQKAWKDTLNHWTNDDKYKIKGLVKPRQALMELAKILPENVMVSTDIGNICSVSNSYLNFNNADEASFLAAMTFGNCQYSVPSIIGAKVANPNRFAVSYTGDGAFGMCFNELLTCVRENIPITCVVFNNQQWGAEKKNQILWFGDRYIGVNLDNNDNNISFANIANNMGCVGIKCDHVDQINDAVLKGKENQMEKGITTVIEIMCTKELGDPFRRDAMKLPQRFLHKYKDTIQHKESETGQPTDI